MNKVQRIKVKGQRKKEKIKLMMKFEDLEVWKRAARLSADLYKEQRELKDFGFKDQITRSGLSIPSK